MKQWCIIFLGLVFLAAASPAAAEDGVSFSRDVQPILARHCFACHGPDAASRESDLRLDLLGDLAENPARHHELLAPGRPDNSDLLRRVAVAGESRMPPAPADSLSSQEIQVLTTWIRSGARHEEHWAFLPLRGAAPSGNSYSNPIDALLAEDKFSLLPAANPEILLRRAYLDLLGLPPTPQQRRDFLAACGDDFAGFPSAFRQLIDSLLASPRYGERWGRHWLDVARYADSNGGDENHAYPHAHRYRDYVIDAFNQDDGFDVFVRQQLAGDLLSSEGADGELAARRIAATGYLAIGMKILAERDPVKKQADLVDEQINTFGRTFLGLSIGCARCHDHKFDPITTRDYYALAGVFHSTRIVDRPLPDARLEEQIAEHNERTSALTQRISQLEEALDASATVAREAEDFEKGNVTVDRDNYGKDIGIISDPGAQDNFAEYEITLPQAGEFELDVRYAAAASRPGRILVDGKVVADAAFAATTGTWFPDSQAWHREARVQLPAGTHRIRFESSPLMSHLDRWRLIPRNLDSQLARELEGLRANLKALGEKPTRQVAMAVEDADAQNVRVHRRGSHLDLGEEVERGFILRFMERPRTITSGSGRLELAAWLTEPGSPVQVLTARVISNRVWHWHFGVGLAPATDDFGLRGDAPQHAALLDFLAGYLVDHDWSLKQLHRLIMNSAAYQQVRGAGEVERLGQRSLFAQKRLEPEVLRDSMLFAAGELDQAMFRSPMRVKSQDPSPQDAAANLRYYEESRRRSVYLPVVRTNVYSFLTLFDFPNVATPIGGRDETNVPTQALWMFNSAFIKRVSSRLAEEVVADTESTEVRLNQVFERVLTRVPSELERQAMQQALAAFTVELADADPKTRKKQAWAMLVQALFMSAEAMDAP